MHNLVYICSIKCEDKRFIGMYVPYLRNFYHQRMLLHKTLVYSNDSEVLQTVVHKVYRMCNFHGYRYTCTLVCTNKRFTCIHVYVVHR